MPIVQVTLIDGPTEVQKRQLIADLTRVVVDDLDVPEQAVHVVLSEVRPLDWGHAGVPLADTLNR